MPEETTNQPPKRSTSKPETIGNDGYTEISKLSINASDIIFLENPDAKYRYMVVENRYTSYFNEAGNNNIFTGYTNDYLEAITEFTERVQSNIDCVQSTRDWKQRMFDVDYVELKSTDCLIDSHNNNFTDELLIVKASELKPEHRSSENQLIICTQGSGAMPNAKGTSVFGNELLSGENVCYGRHQIAGIADPAKLPAWATQKMALLANQNLSPNELGKKLTLQEKLDAAKEIAKLANAENDSRNPKNKQSERA